MASDMMIWIAVAGVVAVAIWRFVLRSKLSYKLPPGTVGWPLLGEFIPFYFRPREFITQRRKLCGNLFRTSLLGYPTIISTDPHVNNFILKDDGQLFVPQYPSSVQELLGKTNILSSLGDSHKRKRGAVMRFIGNPVLKHRILSKIQKIIASNLSGWKGRTVNVMDEAHEMIFSLMAHHLLSLAAGTELDKLKHDFYIFKKGFISLPLKWPGTSFYKSLQKRRELCNQIQIIIQERKSMSSLDSYDDLISSILKDAAEKEDGESEFKTYEIAETILKLMIASIETTPKTIALVVMHLSKNPHIIEELREEHIAIRRANGNNESLSWDDYRSMAFTKSVIKEALRLGNGYTNTIMLRKTIENVEIEGYIIPKGWTCMILDEFFGMDSNYFTDPLTFNPRRWLGQDANRLPFLAFGGGSRHCMGYELAMLVISFFLHQLVMNFEWEYIPTDKKIRRFDSPFTSNIDYTLRVENLLT